MTIPRCTGRPVCGVVLALTALVVSPSTTFAEPITVVAVNNILISFDSATPGTLSSQVGITGLQAGEAILAIDFRPANGALYGLGSSNRLYTINQTTGAATQVGSAGAFTLSGTSFGFDFNPTVDRIRVVSDTDQNLRLNPNDGSLTATDTPITPSGQRDVFGSAYTNNFAGATTTTLYAIDSGVNGLFIQNPPNNGTLIQVGAFGVDPQGAGGFDISGLSGIAYAGLTVGTAGSQLFIINLTTGAATLVGNIGSTPLSVTALAAPIGAQVPEPGTLALMAAGLLACARRAARSRR
jgi:hypothetical protein